MRLADENKMVKYLAMCFDKIVKPMTIELKNFMKNYQISTESEIFCNDL